MGKAVVAQHSASRLDFFPGQRGVVGREVGDDLTKSVHGPGRISAGFCTIGDIEYGLLTRSAITGAGILGHSFNRPRIYGSKASATRPRRARSYFGGRSEFNAARTVSRATPSRREISLMGASSARCSRRISAQSSTLSTLLH